MNVLQRSLTLLLTGSLLLASGCSTTKQVLTKKQTDIGVSLGKAAVSSSTVAASSASGSSSSAAADTSVSAYTTGSDTATSGSLHYTLPSIRNTGPVLDSDGNTPSATISSDSAGLFAVDGQGRKLLTYADVGGPKANRYVGINYYLWNSSESSSGTATGGQNPNKYISDNSKVIEQWGIKAPSSKYADYSTAAYWAEPEIGYYNQNEKWAIKRHLRMLMYAGVDFLYIDATNGYTYPIALNNLLSSIQDLQNEGYNPPKIIFWTTLSSTLMDKVLTYYQNSAYKSCWFYWDGKPMMMYKLPSSNDRSILSEPPFSTLFSFFYSWSNDAGNPHYGTADALKDAILDGPEFVGYPYNAYTFTDKVSVFSMSAATAGFAIGDITGNQFGPVSTSGRNTRFNKVSGYDMFGQRGTFKDMGRGLYQQQRWDDILSNKNGLPEIVVVSRWNEWTAQQWNKNLNYPPKFVDEYNAEFSRDIEPMLNGYTDDYYYQLCNNIRRYKGVSKPKAVSASKTIDISADFSQWSSVTPVFTDWVGDTSIRHSLSSDNQITYTNTTGRNDIVQSRSTLDAGNVYFFAESKEKLTDPLKSKNWMLLYIDSDNNNDTGWQGYDYLINKTIVNSTTATICKYDSMAQVWKEVGCVGYSYSGNMLQISVPRSLLGLTSGSLHYNFKWHDNAQKLYDIEDTFLNGDAAPDRRWNYSVSATCAYDASEEKNKLAPRAQEQRSLYMDSCKPDAPYKLTRYEYKLLMDDAEFAALPKDYTLKYNNVDTMTYSRIPDFSLLKPALSSTVQSISDVRNGVTGRTYNYAIKYEGYIHSPVSGNYSFSADAVSGCRVYIDDRLIVDASDKAASGTIALGANSKHNIDIEYYFSRDNRNDALQTNKTARMTVLVSYPGVSGLDVGKLLLIS